MMASAPEELTVCWEDNTLEKVNGVLGDKCEKAQVAKCCKKTGHRKSESFIKEGTIDSQVGVFKAPKWKFRDNASRRIVCPTIYIYEGACSSRD